MQKIILDTNVIVSSLIQKNYPYLIVEHCVDGNALICLSSEILQEYIEVLSRPKFSRFADFKTTADFLIARLSEMAETYEPKTKLNVIADEPDNRLLELAQISKADFIVTGNTTDFSMDSFDIGVLPNFLKTKEIAHYKLTELILVETMHERKTKMNELSDGVIALPGGFGTLEELFEMLTWGQLGLHEKPIGILNIDGFYNGLIDFLDTMVEKGFLKDLNRNMILISHDINDLLNKMRNYEAPKVGKWITKETS